jgi:hypothetical protein
MAMALPWVAEEAWLYSKYDLDFQLAYIASSGIVIAAMSSGSGAVGCCWRVNDRSALFWAAIPSFVCIGSVKNVLNHSKTRDSVVALEGCESTEKAVYFIQEPSIVAWHRIAI